MSPYIRMYVRNSVSITDKMEFHECNGIPLSFITLTEFKYHKITQLCQCNGNLYVTEIGYHNENSTISITKFYYNN